VLYLLPTSVATMIFARLDLNLVNAASRSRCGIMECRATQATPTSVNTIDNTWQYLPPQSNHVITAWCCTAVTCWLADSGWVYSNNTHTHPFNGPFSGTTRVSRYQKGKTNLDFTEARDDEWQWHSLGHMQVCTSLQTDNHASTPQLSFFTGGCPSCHPTNSVKALKALSL